MSTSNTTLAEAWLSFLREIDQQIEEIIVLLCLGGFAMTQRYGLERNTRDFDVLSIAPPHMHTTLQQLAGPGSHLARKYKVYLDIVGVASLPYAYEERLTDFCPGMFERVRLQVLDPYDLALSKLSRNLDRDHDEVMYLARTTPFDLDLFGQRYSVELRPLLLGTIAEKDDWFQGWLEDIRNERDGSLA